MALLSALIQEAITTGDLVQIWTSEGYQKVYPVSLSDEWMEYMVHYKDGDVSSGLIRLAAIVRAERPYRPKVTSESLHRLLAGPRKADRADEAGQGKAS